MINKLMIKVNKYYECPYTCPEALQILKKFDIKNIIELGTREGNCTKELSLHFPQSKILTFEANPLAKERCTKYLEKIKNIEFIPCAVGSIESYLDFHFYHLNNDGASSLLKRHDYNLSQKTLEQKILCRRLDNVLKDKNWKKVDYLCADIQGYELEALNGLGTYIEDCKFIFLEVPKKESSYQGAPNNKQIMEYMESKGFKACLEIKENDLESNFLFAKTFLDF